MLCVLTASVAFSQPKPADPLIPHVEKRGSATQFIVDGKPFLALSGELTTPSPPTWNT